MSGMRRVDECKACGFMVTLCPCDETPSEAYQRGWSQGGHHERSKAEAEANARAARDKRERERSYAAEVRALDKTMRRNLK